VRRPPPVAKLGSTRYRHLLLAESYHMTCTHYRTAIAQIEKLRMRATKGRNPEAVAARSESASWALLSEVCDAQQACSGVLPA